MEEPDCGTARKDGVYDTSMVCQSAGLSPGTLPAVHGAESSIIMHDAPGELRSGCPGCK